MSKTVQLELNKPEEAIAIDLNKAVSECQLPSDTSAITDYFTHTQGLVTRFLKPEFSGDAIALSLLLLGVVSAAEFYFRSILAQCLEICPYALKHAERVQVPLGSISYYGTKPRALGLSVFEHKSLAGSAEIKNEVSRLLGIAIPSGSSVATALIGFDSLCELRHAAIHTRGFISSKAAADLGLPYGSLQKIDIIQASAFDLTKLSHNAVRSFNRFLINAILDRWIAKKHLTGTWKADKAAFTKLFNAFVHPDESTFSNNIRESYKTIQPALLSRANA